MALIRRKRVLAAKVEGTVGTAETLTAAEAAFNCFNTQFQYNIEMEEREGQGGFNYIPSVPGGQQGTITFTTEISYDGANIPSWASVFLPACGWVNSAGVFTPKTAPPGTAAGVKTLTMAVYEDGKRKIISGAMGSFVIELVSGKIAKINWTFTGKAEAETDLTLLAPTYPTTKASRFAGGYFQHNNVSYCPLNVTVNSGNTVSPLECPTTTNGFKNFYVGNRKPMITCDPLEELIATVDRQTIWTGMTEYEVDIQIPGEAGTIEITAPKAQIVNRQEGDRAGLQSDQLEFQCNRNGATHDEELSINFTAAV